MKPLFHPSLVNDVTDVVCSAENIFRIKGFAAGSDYLFIEAMFLQKDERRAQEKYHLTALQAGFLARKAGVARVIPFHSSGEPLGSIL